MGSLQSSTKLPLDVIAVLRTPSGLVEAPVADDAADARRWEQLFVDYAGTTIDVVDALTGEVHVRSAARS